MSFTICKFSASVKDYTLVRAVHRGGAAEAVAPPPRKLNLQFLFYFKYIGQDKSCLIFKYIGPSARLPPWEKNPAYGPDFGILY